MPEEARLEDVGNGLAPVTEGWFVVNARDAAWSEHDVFGRRCGFELGGTLTRDRPDLTPVYFEQLGIGIAVLEVGKPSTLYHAEPESQEAFLVLSGRCLATIENEQRELGPWDFVHCPPGTKHSFTGAGDGPCVLLMVGTRAARSWRYYPTPLAESVETETDDPAEAYAAYERWRPATTRPEL